MLTEQTLYQQIYNIDQTITIHRFQVVFRDGIEISRSNPHTKTIAPGDDYSLEDTDTQKMCAALWTDTVIAEYKASLTPSLEVQNG